MLVKVRQFLTKAEENPVPMRTMRLAELKRETSKAILVKLEGASFPSSMCLHCGRTITHPVSLMYGIGPVCGGHFHVDTTGQAEENYKRIQEQMAKTTWEGWLPKSAIEIQPEKGWKITFKYQGRGYRVTTYDEKRRDEIKAKADEIVEIEEVS